MVTLIIIPILITNFHSVDAYLSSENHRLNISYLLAEKLQSHRKTSFINDLLLFHYPFTNQSTLSRFLETYSRPRDFHSNPPPLLILAIQLSNLISQFVNSTLVSATDLNASPHGSEGIAGYPTISAFLVNSQVFNMYDEERASANPRRIPVSLFLSSGLNFAYCSRRRKLDHTAITVLKLLLGKADIWVGICLVVSILGIALILKNDGIEAYYFVTILAIISPITCKSSKSTLFQIWMLGCIVVSTCYLGDLAGEMISPTRDTQMTTFEELLERNYSLMYDSPRLKNRVREYVASSPETRNNSGNFGMKIMNLVNAAVATKTKEEFMDTFVREESSAYISNWMGTMLVVHGGNTMILERGLQSRRCYLGKDLRLYINFWFAFTGSDKEKLSRCFRHIVEAGYVVLWEKEMIGSNVVQRVQDRSRFKGPTSIVQDKEEPRPLRMVGKFQNVIYLWLSCLSGCILALAAECLGKWIRSQLSGWFVKQVWLGLTTMHIIFPELDVVTLQQRM